MRRGWEKRVNEWVKTKLTETATKSKDWYDRRWKAKEKDIRVGYEVMVSTKVGAWKGKVRWIGPYKVKKVVNEVNVKLEECAGGPELKIHNRVHMNRIKVILTKRKEREEERVIERKEIGYEGGSEDSSEEEWARGFQADREEESDGQVKQEQVGEEQEEGEMSKESDDVSGPIEDESMYKITKEVGTGRGKRYLIEGGDWGEKWMTQGEIMRDKELRESFNLYGGKIMLGIITMYVKV